MNPDELEFLGEKTQILIIPTFNIDGLHLISGDFGPFRATLPVFVPLWVAVSLKQQRKCNIKPPDWMDMENLEALKEDEKRSGSFIKMPSDHYMVEAKLLLDCASDDIPRADEVRTAIKDIWDIRMSKIRSSVTKLVQNNDFYAALNNLTIMEINSVRPILPHALDHLYRMKRSRRLRPENFSGSSSSSSSLLKRPSTSYHLSSVTNTTSNDESETN